MHIHDIRADIRVAILGLALVSCGQDAPSVPATPTPTAVAVADRHAAALRPAVASAHRNAKQLFAEVLRQIAEQYVDPQLSEDALWSGAIDGLLGRLIQLERQRVNELLSPDRLRELQGGLRGSVSGVGVVLQKFANLALVRDVLPRGPAAEAGIAAGDRILEVDGKATEPLSQAALLEAIRGPEGSTVKLLVQRDAREWTAQLTRRLVKVEPVFGALLPERVGYLRLTSFNQTTLAALDAQLATLARRGATSLILDLRDCPGGLLDTTIAAAERFLPAGKLVVTLKRRHGASEDKVTSGTSGERTFTERPLAVLVNRKTASGAEILAAAIAGHKRGSLIGEPTLGKGSVEKIIELRDGFALKLTTARFVGPDGKSWQSTGLQPQLHIPAAAPIEALYSTRPSVSLDTDAQLRAAHSVLKLR